MNGRPSPQSSAGPYAQTSSRQFCQPHPLVGMCTVQQDWTWPSVWGGRRQRADLSRLPRRLTDRARRHWVFGNPPTMPSRTEREMRIARNWPEILPQYVFSSAGSRRAVSYINIGDVQVARARAPSDAAAAAAPLPRQPHDALRTSSEIHWRNPPDRTRHICIAIPSPAWPWAMRGQSTEVS